MAQNVGIGFETQVDLAASFLDFLSGSFHRTIVRYGRGEMAVVASDRFLPPPGAFTAAVRNVDARDA